MSGIGAVINRIGQIEQRLEQLGLKTPATQLGQNFNNFLQSQLLGDATGKEDNNGIDAEAKNTSVDKADILSLINNTANQAGLDPALVKAVTQVESNFNPYAVSKAGAQGLMQLMPGTGAEMGATDLLNPAQNIKAGSQYLKTLLNKYQDIPKAVAAYNAGPGAVDKYHGIPPYAETTQYVKKVLAAYEANKEAGALQ